MDEKLFAELIASIQEGAAILRGEKEPSRRFTVETDANNLKIRNYLKRLLRLDKLY